MDNNTNDQVAAENVNASTSSEPVVTGESSAPAETISTPAAVSDEVQTPSGADSTESNAPVETTVSPESVGDVSAEQSDVSEPSSDASLSSDSSNGAEASLGNEAVTNEPNHAGYLAELINIAKGVEIEITEDVAELEKKLKDYSVEFLNAVERFKIKHNIA